MNIENKLKGISLVLKKKKFVRVEITKRYAEFNSRVMMYLGPESFKLFPKQIGLYEGLEYDNNSRSLIPVEGPHEISVNEIKRLTILKT